MTILDPTPGATAARRSSTESRPPVILLGYLDLTASFTGPATICLPIVASFGSLDGARMLHYENGSWIDITVSVDPVTRIVCGSTLQLLAVRHRAVGG